MTDEQKLDDQPGHASEVSPGAPEVMAVELDELEDSTPAVDMIPEPDADPPAEGAVVQILGDDEPTVAESDFVDLDSGTPQVETAPEPVDAGAEAQDEAVAIAGGDDVSTPSSVDESVAPLTAADIPALEGCDVEKSWAGDETCEGTDALTAATPDAEAESGLEAAEGEIAPEPQQAGLPDEGVAVQGESARVSHAAPTWPFVAYLVLWVVLCGLAGWQLSQIPGGEALTTSDAYRIAVIGGVVMTVVGPLLIFAVWLASWMRADDQSRAGLLASALLKGSAVTLLGVVLWWGTFLVVDQLRFGRLI